VNDALSVERLSQPAADDAPATAYVRVAGVGKTFALPRKRSIKALDGITFDVARGELVAVVGPSGCG
jgi:ABC-type glutathione transport system ATPase component